MEAPLYALAQVAIITRSVDRLLQKKLHNLLSPQAIRAATPFLPLSSPITRGPLSPLPSAGSAKPAAELGFPLGFHFIHLGMALCSFSVV